MIYDVRGWHIDKWVHSEAYYKAFDDFVSTLRGEKEPVELVPATNSDKLKDDHLKDIMGGLSAFVTCSLLPSYPEYDCRNILTVATLVGSMLINDQELPRYFVSSKYYDIHKCENNIEGALQTAQPCFQYHALLQWRQLWTELKRLSAKKNKSMNKIFEKIAFSKGERKEMREIMRSAVVDIDKYIKETDETLPADDFNGYFHVLKGKLSKAKVQTCTSKRVSSARYCSGCSEFMLDWKRCPREKAWYCSVKCQKKDITNHKRSCSFLNA